MTRLMKKLIVVADWANDSLYASEYKSAVAGYVDSQNTLDISLVNSTNSSISASFLLSQAALTEQRLGEPHNTVIHIGTEPRNTTDPFLVIKLTSGIYVCGINNEYTFTLIKDSIEKAFGYRVEAAASGFMSRDVYSRVIAHLLQSLEHDLDLEEIHTNTIPQLQETYIGHIDVFGNMITTVKHEDISAKYSEGDEIEAKIGSEIKKAVYKKNIWSGENGQLIIGPSSFGPLDNPYVSIVVKSGSASALFQDAKTGTQVQL